MCNKKKIVLAIGSLKVGGAELQALLLAQYLQSRQYQVEIWGMGEPGDLTQRCDKAGIAWRSVPKPLEKNLAILKNIRSLAAFARAVRRARPEIIISYTVVMNLACALIWRFSRAKCCIWNQRDAGVGMAHLRKLPLFRRLSSFYLSNSEHGMTMLQRNYNIPTWKCAVIPNGVAIPEKSEDQRQITRTRLNLSADHFAACMVGNIQILKDHLTLLRSWRKVVDHYFAQRKVVLLLAGRPDEPEQVYALVKELHLEQHICFLGYVENVHDILNAVDLGVFSSPGEGLPNGVLECMAAGLAVAASDLPGVRMALPEKYHQQCLAEPGNAGELAEKIIFLIDHQDQREEIGRINRQKVIDCFSIETMGRKYLEIIKQLLPH